MICFTGAEWNFVYILPGQAREAEIMVVPRSPNIGWTLSPTYFYTYIETSRDM